MMSPGMPPAIVPIGRRSSGEEMAGSISLFGRIAGLGFPGPSVNVGPKSKNVCQPMKCRRARAPTAQVHLVVLDPPPRGRRSSRRRACAVVVASQVGPVRGTDQGVAEAVGLRPGTRQG